MRHNRKARQDGKNGKRRLQRRVRAEPAVVSLVDIKLADSLVLLLPTAWPVCISTIISARQQTTFTLPGQQTLNNVYSLWQWGWRKTSTGPFSMTPQHQWTQEHTFLFTVSIYILFSHKLEHCWIHTSLVSALLNSCILFIKSKTYFKM